MRTTIQSKPKLSLEQYISTKYSKPNAKPKPNIYLALNTEEDNGRCSPFSVRSSISNNNMNYIKSRNASTISMPESMRTTIQPHPSMMLPQQMTVRASQHNFKNFSSCHTKNILNKVNDELRTNGKSPKVVQNIYQLSQLNMTVQQLNDPIISTIESTLDTIVRSINNKQISDIKSNLVSKWKTKLNAHHDNIAQFLDKCKTAFKGKHNRSCFLLVFEFINEVKEELPNLEAIIGLLGPGGNGFFQSFVKGKTQFIGQIRMKRVVEEQRLLEQGAPDYYFNNLKEMTGKVMNDNKIVRLIHEAMNRHRGKIKFGKAPFALKALQRKTQFKEWHKVEFKWYQGDKRFGSEIAGRGITISKGDGFVLIGYRINGMYDGPCTMFRRDGSVEEGKWKNYCRVGTWMTTFLNGKTILKDWGHEETTYVSELGSPRAGFNVQYIKHKEVKQ